MRKKLTTILKKSTALLSVTFQGGIILHCISEVINKTAIIPMSFWG